MAVVRCISLSLAGSHSDSLLPMCEGVHSAVDKRAVAPVSVTITLTERDIRAGFADFSGGLWRPGSVIAIGAALFFTLPTRHGRPITGTDIATVTIILVLYAVISSLLPYHIAKNQISVLKRVGDTNMTYRFDDVGVTIRSTGAMFSVVYRSLVRIRRGKRTLLLFTTGQIAQIVPLRAFTPDELTRVLAFFPPNPQGYRDSPWKRLVLHWLILVAAFLGIYQLVDSGGANEVSTPPSGCSD